MDSQYQYYAFISYKREDEKWAKWLQKKLEHYKLPTSIRKVNPALPETVRPIFKDTTDLSGGVLEKAIKNALASSKYLIVICSPRAAQSPWVCKEVQEFIDSSREEFIIPFIVDGEPNSKDIATECFPKNLRELTNNRELLGINVNDMGSDAAAIKVVARMFGLHFDTLWRRWEREKRKKQVIAIVSVLTLFLISLFVSLLINHKNVLLKESHLELLKSQTRSVAAKSMDLIVENDYYSAARLVTEVLPIKLETPNRPFCVEAERALRYSLQYNSCVLKGHDHNVNSAFFSHDDSKIVSASDDGTIRVWDAKNGVELHNFNCNCGFVSSAMFSPDDSYIVAGYQDCKIRIWDVKTASIARVLEGHTGNILSCSFSHDGKFIVSSAGGDGSIRLWDVESGKNILTFQGDSYCNHQVSFSPDDRYILSVSGGDDQVRIWDKSTGTQLRQFPGESVYSATYSPNGNYIVLSSSSDNASHVWNLQSGKKEKVLKGHSGYVEYSVFSPDGKSIASASEDETIIIWDARNGRKKEVLTGHKGPVMTISYSSSGNRLVSASYDNTIRLWDLRKSNSIKTLIGHKSFVSCADFDSSRNKIISSSRGDGILFLWDANTGKSLQQLNGHDHFVFTVSYSNDDRYFLSASLDGTIKMWDANSLELISMYTDIKYPTGIACFSPDAKFIAYGDGTVLKIFEVSSGTVVMELCGRDDAREVAFCENISSISYSPDGNYVATATYGDKTIRVWDLNNGELFRVYNGHADAVETVCFSPNGKYLASAGYDANIKIWSMENSSRELMTLKGHKYSVNMVTYNKTGNLLASAGGDGTIKIWDVNSGMLLQELLGHTNGVNSIAFNRSGDCLVSASEDKTIRIWEFPPLQLLIDEARERFKERPLTPEERREYYLE